MLRARGTFFCPICDGEDTKRMDSPSISIATGNPCVALDGYREGQKFIYRWEPSIGLHQFVLNCKSGCGFHGKLVFNVNPSPHCKREACSVLFCEYCKAFSCNCYFSICECGNEDVCSKCIEYCDKCSSKTCLECLNLCTRCDTTLCENCVDFCTTCDVQICNDISGECIRSCQICSSKICRECSYTCARCDVFLCDNCAEVCTTCEEVLCLGRHTVGTIPGGDTYCEK